MAGREGSRSRRSRRQEEGGQTLAEFALALVPFLLVLLGALHFALAVHARQVVQTAAVEGARMAAAEPANIARGEARARSVLQDGLGRWGQSYTVQGTDQGETVRMRVQGHYILALPLLGARDLSLSAEAVVRKEGFRPGP